MKKNMAYKEIPILKRKRAYLLQIKERLKKLKPPKQEQKVSKPTKKSLKEVRYFTIVGYPKQPKE